MLKRIKSWGLMTTLLLATAVSANGGAIKLVCKYSTNYPSNDEVASIVPIDLEIESSSSSASWNATVSGLPVKISKNEFTFSFGEFNYTISRISGEIRFLSMQGLESANVYRREMTRGLMRQGKSVQDAQAEVEARLQQRLSANEHRGTCERNSGYISR